MNNKELTKRNLLLDCLIIAILIIHYVLCYFNLHNLINSNDELSSVIGVLGLLALNYTIISIIIQTVVLVLNYINKQTKQSLNILALIIEIIYFIFTNFAVTPLMILNLAFFNKLLANLVLIIFEALNIYAIILMIKQIIQSKKVKDQNK